MYAAIVGWRVLCQLVKWVVNVLYSLKKWIWLCWVLAVACGVFQLQHVSSYLSCGMWDLVP